MRKWGYVVHALKASIPMGTRASHGHVNTKNVTIKASHTAVVLPAEIALDSSRGPLRPSTPQHANYTPYDCSRSHRLWHKFNSLPHRALTISSSSARYHRLSLPRFRAQASAPSTRRSIPSVVNVILALPGT
jgi:hypothetical protein